VKRQAIELDKIFLNDTYMIWFFFFL
jgi:hypothetical protein